MKLYGLSGLGADKRVFQFLTLDCELVPIEWIAPEKQESLEAYAQRLSAVVNTKEDFGLIGVSFGGLIAVELSKILNPTLTILISSVETNRELRPLYRLLGKVGLLKVIPTKLFNPPRFLANWIFGAKQKELLDQILSDTDLKFAKWAVNELLTWKNRTRVKGNLLKICGAADKLLPAKEDSQTELIDNGEHFMIVDRAEELSRIINEELRT